MSPRFRMLGPIRLDGDHRSVTPATHLRRGLLVALTSRPGRTVSFERVIARLWSRPTSSSRSNLRTQLSLLRKDLEAAQPGLSQRISVIRSSRSCGGEGGGIRFDAADDEVDLLRVRQLARSARGLLRAESWRLAEVEERSRRALAYFDGDVGVDLPTTVWFDDHRERAELLQLSLLETLATAQFLAGRPVTGRHELAEQLSRHPFREPLWRLLIAVPVAAGDPVQGLASFDRCRLAFQEYGLDLPGGLSALHHPILDGDIDALRLLLRRG